MSSSPSKVQTGPLGRRSPALGTGGAARRVLASTRSTAIAESNGGPKATWRRLGANGSQGLKRLFRGGANTVFRLTLRRYRLDRASRLADTGGAREQAQTLIGSVPARILREKRPPNRTFWRTGPRCDDQEPASGGRRRRGGQNRTENQDNEIENEDRRKNPLLQKD